MCSHGYEKKSILFCFARILHYLCTMKLHIFNPEHDIALASKVPQFTAPHSARELRTDLDYIPALWADDGDLVLVDDVEAAIESMRHLKCHTADVLFVTPKDVTSFQFTHHDDTSSLIKISPWGWDAALKYQLTEMNQELNAIMPDDDYLSELRKMSNRRWASKELLPVLVSQDDKLIGESEYVDSFPELECMVSSLRDSVLKAPWSSSGRGIRYAGSTLDDHQQGWAQNIINRQGGVMIEPRYNKVKDFGMEFTSDTGDIKYEGLSLFKTINGSYAGNILACEEDKMKMLSRYVSVELINHVKETIVQTLGPLFMNKYDGPFGIDMMIVSDKGQFKLHPCVELNLRRTMGHVAIALSPSVSLPQRLMNISYTNKYRIRVSDSHENIIRNTLL